MRMHNSLFLEPAPSLLGGPSGGGTPPPAGGAPPAGGGNWLDSLPKDLHTETITKFKSPEELARGYVNAQALIGQKRLAAPNDKWGETEWKSFYKELGVPDAPDGYKTPELKLPEGIKLDDARVKKANEALHKAGLTPKQHEAVLRYYGETLSEQHTASAQQRQAALSEGTNALKAEWGDKFDAHLDIARSVIAKFGDEGLMDTLVESGAANNPAFIKALHKIGSAILEDSARGRGDGGLKVMDSTAALQEIDSLKLDKEFQKALGTANHPAHKAAVERWTLLHGKAHKDKSADQV